MTEEVTQFPGGKAAEPAASASETKPGAAIVDRREATHGGFENTARVWHRLQTAVNEELAAIGTHAGELEPVIAFGLTFELAKIARVVSGDPTFLDHWEDIAGYGEGVAAVIRKVKGGG